MLHSQKQNTILNIHTYNNTPTKYYIEYTYHFWSFKRIEILGLQFPKKDAYHDGISRLSCIILNISSILVGQNCLSTYKQKEKANHPK